MLRQGERRGWWPWRRPQPSASWAEDFSSRCVPLFEPETTAVNIVFIHDLIYDGPWQWHLATEFPTARILAFEYNTRELRGLGDILDPEKLERYAKELLRVFPLRHYRPSSPGAFQERMPGQDLGGTLKQIEQPIIFIAHGFGGLIYEQALVFTNEPDMACGKRRHAVLLLDTPHHRAGLAEWAIMCAKQLGIPCANTAQKQDWSDFKDQLARIHDMQKLFRVMIRQKVKVNTAACFATSPVLKSELMLSPEWAVLPDFTPIAVNDDHFGMTKWQGMDASFKSILKLLNQWMSELAGQGIDDGTKPLFRNPHDELKKLFQPAKPREFSSPLVFSPLIQTQGKESLNSRLTESLIVSPIDRTKYFLPRDALDMILDSESVLEFLETVSFDNGDATISDLRDYICGPETTSSDGIPVRMARKIFAVLILIGKPSLITDFAGDGVYDDHLPLIRADEHGAKFGLERRDDKLPPLTCFRDWPAHGIRQFDEYQWYMLVPRFTLARMRSLSSTIWTKGLSSPGRSTTLPVKGALALFIG